jgi:hypothetical protein
LTLEQVLAWADAHHAATGRWPTSDSGQVPAAPRETWSKIAQALRMGHRGLPKRGSLARVLAEHRGRPNPARPALLGLDQILAWAEKHRAATGQWPGPGSGPVADAPAETWLDIAYALLRGERGLPGDMSLFRLQFERPAR